MKGHLVICMFLCASPGPAVAHEDLLTQLRDLDRRIATAPAADLLARRADLRRRHREWDLALDDYRAAEALAPGDPGIAMGRARIFLDRGMPGDALRELEPVVGKLPANGPGLLLQARALGSCGRIDESSESFEKASAHLKPALPEHFIEHADLLAAATPARLLPAIAVLDEGIAKLGELISLHSKALEFELRGGITEAALARTRRIIAGPGSGNPRWRVTEGELLASLGRRDEAAETLTAALKQIRTLELRRRKTPALLEIEGSAEKALEKLGNP